MRIGIDLLWVRPNKCGGTESLIRNLLDGFAVYDHDNVYYLFTAKDNHESFVCYKKYSNMKLVRCNTISDSPILRLLWENVYLDRVGQKHKLEIMFIPVYSKPWSFGSNISYVVNIADLQAQHYPEYFSLPMNIYMRYIWWFACATSRKIVTISNWCKKDIEKNYPVSRGKVQTIYVPIITKKTIYDFEILEHRYGIKRNGYYYCVSSMLPHKNLKTVLYALSLLKKRGRKKVLVISGVGGQVEEMKHTCRELDIEDCIIDTGFVKNEERDCLYDNCSVFLFPSIFEGFGMPPIEAMRRGKRVVMTRKTCLNEVTDGKAVYVDNPFDPEEWIEKIETAEKLDERVIPFVQYNNEQIAMQYIDLWSKV